MEIMITLCNKRNWAECTELPEYFVFKLKLPGGQIQPIPLSHSAISQAKGATGLVPYGDGWAVALQTKPLSILHFKTPENSSGKPQLVHWRVGSVRAGHSLALSKTNHFWIASTGTDRIVEFSPPRHPFSRLLQRFAPRLLSRERVLHQATTSGRDHHHLNSVTLHQGKLWWSAFGERPDSLWSGAENGYLACEDGRQISPIYHPHSLHSYDGKLYYCESSRMRVRTICGEQLQLDQGYLRGLAICEEFIFVGSSRGRERSESTGAVILNPSEGHSDGRCEILQFRRNGPRLEDCELIARYNLERYGREIFDLALRPQQP